MNESGASVSVVRQLAHKIENRWLSVGEEIDDFDNDQFMGAILVEALALLAEKIESAPR
jgi:hypothetical protein